NIVLTLVDKYKHKDNRLQLYQLFKPKTKGTFTYEEDGDTRSIDYYVESIDITSTGTARTATVSLICPDPFFEAPNDITVTMAGWARDFEFIHEFFEEGEELGHRIEEKLKTIQNDTGAEGIGLTINIYASGAVSNPSITHIEAEEFIKIGTTAHPMDMVNGDVLQITTGTNNKHVYLIRGGEKTEINEYLDEKSEFIQLQSGKNTIGYNADAGENYMTVSLSYRHKFLGV
ncbi:MAG: phage tail family protein, partial [Prevotellaceae bacterium]|nr:phage tail family protein [Prevotellaceae bacterium]